MYDIVLLLALLSVCVRFSFLEKPGFFVYQEEQIINSLTKASLSFSDSIYRNWARLFATSALDIVSLRRLSSLFGAFLPILGFFISLIWELPIRNCILIATFLIFENSLHLISHFATFDIFNIILMSLSFFFFSLMLRSRSFLLKVITGALAGLYFTETGDFSLIVGYCLSVAVLGALSKTFKLGTIYALLFSFSLICLIVPWKNDEPNMIKVDFLSGNETFWLANMDKNREGRPVYLHSHDLSYPGTERQSVTCYMFDCNNNYFELISLDEEKVLENNDSVYLRHCETNSFLVVEDLLFPSIVHIPSFDDIFYPTKNLYQISAGESMEKSSWIIMSAHGVENFLNGDKISTKLQKDDLLAFYNIENDCFLQGSWNSLGDWCLQQGAVTCSKDFNGNSTLWQIERCKFKTQELEKDLLKIGSETKRKTCSFIDIVSLNCGVHLWTLGLRQVYFFGNPFIWWSVAASVVLSGYVLYSRPQTRRFHIVLLVCIFLRLLLIEMKTSIDYVPTLVFGIFLVGSSINQTLIIMLLSITVFCIYFPLSMGFRFKYCSYFNILNLFNIECLE